MIKKSIQTLTLVACFGFGMSTHAALLSYNGDGQVIGINDVPIGAEHWNATFISGSFNDATPPIYSRWVDNFALSATYALYDVLQNEFLHTAFDDDPTLTYGCDMNQRCNMATIFDINSFGSSDYRAYAVRNNAPFLISGVAVNQISLEVHDLVVDRSDITFIQWDRVSAVPDSRQVPEPATLALFGLGLAGLGFARKKRKSA